MGDDDYTDKFIACQDKMKSLLARPPIGRQNWSYQKSVNFKKHLKKVEQAIKLVPKSKHVEFLKVEQLATALQEYYK